MPDTLEFPRVRRPVVPLMRARHTVIDELIAARLPGLAAVVRPLDDLPKPSARLRCVKSVRINRRSLHVVDLPAAKVRSAHAPAIARAVGRQNETTLTGAHENSNAAHK